jgi:hypothetical protein
MISFLYLVTEGVHDVAFLGKLLTVGWGASRIRTMEELDDAHRSWIGEFKWPSFHRGKTQIDRLAVPAPVFYRLPEGTVIAVRNAQGISEIGKTLTVDVEAFARIAINPDAIGIVLDSDDEPVEQRFRKVKATLEGASLAAPPALGEVTTGVPRLGVFALPEPGIAGTLEDLLLALGDVAYPALAAAARGYAAEWRAKADAEPAVADWKEMRKPAGTKKAAIAAMTAILKPGRSTQASLEDHRWLSEETRALDCIQPCVAFLNALLVISESVQGSQA